LINNLEFLSTDFSNHGFQQPRGAAMFSRHNVGNDPADAP
jgi:hypothetical protein